MATYEVKRKQLFGSDGIEVEVGTGETHTIVVRCDRAEFLEFPDTLFRNDSTVILPIGIAHSAGDAAASSLGLVAACLEYAKANPSKKLLITGHTDTVGSDQDNLRLSSLRAQAVHGLIAGLRDAFAEACYGPHLTDEQRYPSSNKKKGVLWDDYTDVLDWLQATCGWDCSVKRKGTLWTATRELQKRYNQDGHAGNPDAGDIPLSGKFDQATWKAVYDCYDRRIAELLATDRAGLVGLRESLTFVSKDHPWTGCGEAKPIDQVGRDNYHSQANRRVEAMFFDSGEEPELPCLTASCGAVQCAVYNPGQYERVPIGTLPKEALIPSVPMVGPKQIGAAFNGWGPDFEKYGYFLREGRYRRYNWTNDQMDDGGSLPLLAFHLPTGYRKDIDATMNGHGEYNKNVYFFKGSQYVRYNWNTGRMDQDPVSIADGFMLTGEFTSNLDAALCGQGKYSDYAYFFKGGNYARYVWSKNQVDLIAPLSNWGLPEEFQSGIDGACNGYRPYEGKAYFFKGSRYVRYTWDADQGIDQDYPMEIAVGWPKLLQLAEPPTRRMVPYITVDQTDQHDKAQNNAGHHVGNVNGVRAIAVAFRGNTFVDDFWYPEMDTEALDDPHMLALFLSGGFDEWVCYYRKNTPWVPSLDEYCVRLLGTRTPMFAVCASHQLLGYAVGGGWHGVRHMLGPSIDKESNGKFQAPNPRKGETGVFGHVVVNPDPILDGLPATSYFQEYHSDEVVDSALPATASHLLGPNGIGDADQGPPPEPSNKLVDPGPPPKYETYTYSPLATDAERCQVQAVRYQLQPDGRLLYSTQFHPELAGNSPNAAKNAIATQHGRKLLLNFFGLADGYWTKHP
jgi:GMP synthase-like glutamine amidotransferase